VTQYPPESQVHRHLGDGDEPGTTLAGGQIG